ncbi:DAK2 domain-containing protein [Kroppenstedtia eburnea]|uniref:DAK2 domain-containing protein n=1 Tax=Kroppenstedtia eburnea TaxID=714067 RepID=UPI0009712A15|nr:DAK2 domain-containing protein [Kroppenstedtia eburnea]QKI83753.1 DAK2 domain-containing protein [Kroppenstedtia eburnea]
MLVRVIDSQTFLDMVRAGAERLNRSVDQVNALNVFPVPDGDTGTNMNLTLTSGVKELERASASKAHVGQLAEALSKGLLMGARGNSGVILSQLFRGFGKGVADKEALTSREFAEGLKRGVDTAYKAVIKPVEGTVLTVAREAAEKAVRTAHRTENLAELMEVVLEEARRALQRTPEQLPVLAQAGVVDAGGQGLVRIYEGFLAALTGEKISYTVTEAGGGPVDLDRLGEIAHSQSAQSHFETGDIEHGYCTEFIVKLKPAKLLETPFSEEQFRTDMGRFGDSLLVVADDDLVKVHIHAEHPGETLTYAQRYGELTRIKIDNMREQHATILDTEHRDQGENVSEPVTKRYGLVAVAIGDGVSEIFRSLGVDVVIQGGQTMNPSTEEIVQAVQGIPAEHVFILPNNKNIIMTAEQVTELVEVPVTVLPTRTIPQGLAALLSFNEEADADTNQKRMMESVTDISSGEVTYAVRDSQYEGGTIKEGDFLGIREGRIEAVGADMLATSRELLSRMLANGGDMVTLLYGEDVTKDQVQELTHFLEQDYPDVECEVHYGGQPLYYFLFSVE